MATPLSDFIRQFFNAVETKDIDAVIAYFSHDAELIDPHYPNAHMKGKQAITEGFNWGFKSLKKFGFTVVNYYESEDGMSAAVEVATAHELPNGKKLDFTQTFVFEVNNNRISRLQAYQPYGPHGILAMVLNITRLIRKMTGRD